MKSVFTLLVLILLAAGAYYYLHDEQRGGAAQSLPASLRDLAYRIEGESVQLQDGYAEEEIAQGSASKKITRYFGNEASGDLDGDGVADLGFILTQESGGSGTFFYAAGALKKGESYVAIDATIIGDRIAPQSSEIRNGQLIINYADRAPGEPMSAQPSVGRSLYLKLDPRTMQFGEVVQNFEGESASGERP